MKSIKEYIVDIAIWGVLAIAPIGIIQYRAYNSGFVQSYNEAVRRNAYTLTEELKFKQDLVKEVAGLKEQGRDLDAIVDWLKTR